MTCVCGFVVLDPGETCPYCGFVYNSEPIFLYFSPKENRWIRCRTESFCLKQAAAGFKVKKIAFENVGTQLNWLIFLFYMDKTKLEEKVNESFTLRKLSDHFEVSQSTIRYWLNKYHLKTKNKPYNNCGRYTFKGCTKCGENVLCFVVIVTKNNIGKIRCCSSVGLERQPVTLEAGGSSPLSIALLPLGVVVCTGVSGTPRRGSIP